MGGTTAGRGSSATTRAEDVLRLRGSLTIEHTLARRGAERLWSLMHELPHVAALGALTGNQAVQQVKAGLRRSTSAAGRSPATRTSARRRIPTSRSIPRTPCPSSCADQQRAAPRRPDPVGRGQAATVDWFAPIVADAEAGFGGPLNAYELMRAMIEAGAAGVHFEDQLSSEKKCGHLGGKVVVPTGQFVRTLTAARLAADVAGVPTVLIARTDALSSKLLTSDHDPRDRAVPHRRAHRRGLLPRARRARAGDRALARVRAVRRRALVRDVDAGSRRGPRGSPRRSTRSSRASCSRTTARRRSTGGSICRRADRRFQQELGALGYKFQFVTLAGFHALNESMFELARGYAEEGMTAYVRAAGARVRARGRTATPRRATSARSAPATSTRSRRSSPAGSPRRSRSRARPRRRSSRTSSRAS